MKPIGTSKCCPTCQSIDFWAVEPDGAMERALGWLLRTVRCGLCGHQFYLLIWPKPLAA